MGKEKRYLLRNWKRYMAVVLGITLTVAQLSIPVTAAEGTEAKTGTETGLTAGGLCAHHTAHTDACGYQEAVKGQECNHEHTDACYEEVTDCKHEHTDACYETQSATEEPAEGENPQKMLNCTHVCSEGSGCIVKTLNCTHTHDDTCGFAASVEGSPCTFVCTECSKTGTPQEPGGDTTQGEDGEQESSDRTEAVKNVQELINALPAVDKIETEIETMNEEDKAALKEQLAEAKTAYEELTDEEKKQITGADKLEKLLGFIGGAENQTSDETVTEAVKNVRELIDALPSVDEVKAMNEEDRNAAYARTQETNEAYAALTEEEQTQVDITKIETLFAYFNSLTAVNGITSTEQTDDSVAEVNGVYYTDFMKALAATYNTGSWAGDEGAQYCKLLKDVTVNGDVGSGGGPDSYYIDLNGKTLTCGTLYLGGGKFSFLKGSGTVEGNIEIEGGAFQLSGDIIVYGNILQAGITALLVSGSGVFRVNGNIADFAYDSSIGDGVTIVCTGTCNETTLTSYLQKDGSTLITEPSNLTAIYGQSLSDISLPADWTWVDKDTSVSVGTQSYPARFNTAGYEPKYDFTTVEGYDKTNRYVQHNLSVSVSKGATVLTITTESMDKTYDGNAVAEPSVTKTGSTKAVTFTWYEQNENSWTKLSAAPVNAGIYKVVAAVEADDNYSGTERELSFTINRATPEFTRPVGLTAVYGQCLADVSLPSANGKFLWEENSATKVGDVGAHTFHWTFVPTDNRNFEAVVNQSVTITVTPRPLTDSMIAVIDDQYYTGAAIEPAITVTDTAGIKESDYIVSYSHNTDVGTATVTITGQNNYTGTAFQTFTIKNIDAPDILANGVVFDEFQWYVSDVIIDGATPEEWRVSTDGIHYADTYTVSTEGTKRVDLYFKNAAGYITAAQSVEVHLDKTAPTGKIILESKWWENALTFLSFNHYRADNKQLTIWPADDTSGVDTIEYLIVKGNTQYGDKDDLENAVTSDASLNWLTYDEENKPTVLTDENCGVYAKITDHAGLITYIGTDGLLIDDTVPTITNPAVSTADTDITAHSVKFSFTLSEPATCYYLAVPAAQSAPTQAELLASSQKQTVGAEELSKASARITGLAEGTTYQIYILAVDNAVNISETGGMGNVSTISSTGEFTTKVQVKTPSITPNGGEYTSDKLQVTMTCATEGVTIYYTTDGTRPTTGSSRYQGAFEVTIPATVKAIAVKSGMADSEVASVSYTKKGNTGSGNGGGNSGGNDNNQGDNDSQGNDDTPVQPPVIPVQPTKPPVKPVTPTNPVNPVKPVKPTPEMEEEEPFIKGDDGKEGWPVITGRTETAKDGDKIVVDMNGSTTVPGDVIESVAGRDVTIVFDMGDGILWTVNGKSVTADNISDIRFGVLRNTKNIPVEVINNVTGERYSITITIEHDGEFGFTAVLTVNMEKKNAGLYANLFYYNKAAEELEFMCADEIDADGNTELSFTHASDYTIVIDKEPMDGSGADGEEAAETGTDTAGAGEEEAQDSIPAAPATVEGRKDIMDYLWIILLGAVVIVAGVGGYVYFIGKKKDDEAE